MTTGRRQSSHQFLARRTARLAIAAFAKPLGRWNVEAAHLRALLNSSHLTTPQRHDAQRAAATLFAQVLQSEQELRFATDHFRHPLVDDLRRSYRRLAFQLGETVELSPTLNLSTLLELSSGPHQEKAMPTTQSSRGRSQDRAKVAGGQDHEVRYESNKTGASKSEVKDAVKSAGNSRSKVEQELGKSR